MNPITIAFDALASTISLSEIAPTPLLTMDTFTPSTFIFSKAFLTASSDPFTSVLRSILISLNPSDTRLNQSSKLIAFFLNFFFFSFMKKDDCC